MAGPETRTRRSILPTNPVPFNPTKADACQKELFKGLLKAARFPVGLAAFVPVVPPTPGEELRRPAPPGARNAPGAQQSMPVDRSYFTTGVGAFFGMSTADTKRILPLYLRLIEARPQRRLPNVTAYAPIKARGEKFGASK